VCDQKKRKIIKVISVGYKNIAQIKSEVHIFADHISTYYLLSKSDSKDREYQGDGQKLTKHFGIYL